MPADDVEMSLSMMHQCSCSRNSQSLTRATPELLEGFHWASAGHLRGICCASAGHLLGICWASAGHLLGICWASAGCSCSNATFFIGTSPEKYPKEAVTSKATHAYLYTCLTRDHRHCISHAPRGVVRALRGVLRALYNKRCYMHLAWAYARVSIPVRMHMAALMQLFMHLAPFPKMSNMHL